MKYVLVCILTMLAGAGAKAETMRLAVTTSFNNSGLADLLLPAIEHDTGIEVRLLSVGTGQALRLGRAGDVDAILVHSRAAEEAFVSAGYATHRREIMYNDFVLLGPVNDPAGIASAANATQALARIAGSETPFVSRGDDSGTHDREQALWRLAGMDAVQFGAWYRSIGAGMGAALNAGSAMGAYLLSDRASWLNFKRKEGLTLLFAGDPVLFNQYSYLPVNPQKHPHVKHRAARQLEDWLVAPRARALINDYRLGGERLFTHNAVSRQGRGPVSATVAGPKPIRPVRNRVCHQAGMTTNS